MELSIGNKPFGEWERDEQLKEYEKLTHVADEISDMC